MLLSLTGGIGC